MMARERGLLFSGQMVRAILASKKSETRRLANLKRLKVRLAKAVQGDTPSRLVAQPGVYGAGMNQHGAVWVNLPGGKMLGVKPTEYSWVSPYGEPGDRIWVRETAAYFDECIGCHGEENADDCSDVRHRRKWVYRATEPDALDGAVDMDDKPRHWRPSIYMPREACRIMLEITSVRVERLHAITDAAIAAEGLPVTFHPGKPATADVERHGGLAKGASVAKTVGTARACFEAGWDDLNGKRAAWATNPFVYVVGFQRRT